jgi:hypothetical protein
MHDANSNTRLKDVNPDTDRAGVKQETSINRGAETLDYFKLLDPDNLEAFTLQVFDDNEQRKDITLAATFHGSFRKPQHLKGRFTTLKEANLAGCGIYCTVNERQRA